MATIEHFSNRHLSDEGSLVRIVPTAMAGPGLWLMVKDREMEMRAITAELKRLDADPTEFDCLFLGRLKPRLSKLADHLVSHLRCWRLFRKPLLEAAKRQLTASPHQ